MRDHRDDREYDPFAATDSPVGVRTIQAPDEARGRLFPVEIWYPADWRPQATEQRDAPPRPGAHPLVVFSHYSGGNRRSSAFLCSHLASHGYVVAAMDHSEVVAPELAAPMQETQVQRAARIDAIVSSRVPDVRFLLDHLLGDEASHGQAGPAADGAADIGLDHARIGLVGHSFGGWTALVTPDVEPRVRAVVALAPGGSANPKPGVLLLELAFGWGRPVPALYLAAENDVPVPPAGVHELFGRAPAPKRMFVLRRADHQHFVDDVEDAHEAVRAMSFPGDAAWIPAAMAPITELCSGDQAHLFVRGLTLAHLDAALRQAEAAERFLAGDVTAELAARGVEAVAHQP